VAIFSSGGLPSQSFFSSDNIGVDSCQYVDEGVVDEHPEEKSWIQRHGHASLMLCSESPNHPVTMQERQQYRKSEDDVKKQQL
jgi:PhoPQ-activated pathogenicity-related protein